MKAFGNCVCCSILPPYILRRYAESDDPKVRARAQANMDISRRAWALRSAGAGMLQVSRGGTPAPANKTRRVFDCKGGSDMTLSLVMNEGDAASGDVAVREAYDFAGVTWDFYKTIFNRNAPDDRGMTLVSSVHFSPNGEGFDNALWYRDQMIYGDGGDMLDRTTKCLDVTGHELTHGVTEFSAALPYHGQSGALNEHFSDVFGVVIRQWHEKQTDPTTANWLVGDGLLLTGGALRSMKAPGTANPDDPQPDNMSKYVDLPDTDEGDHGGVHTNSGIPNKAFYLVATSLGKPSWETAAKIWYTTLTQRLKGDTDFQKCALETISVARDFFDDATASKVADAWKQVGVVTENIGPMASLKTPIAPSAPVAAAAAAIALPPKRRNLRKVS